VSGVRREGAAHVVKVGGGRGPRMPRLGMVGRYGVLTVLLVAVSTSGVAWLMHVREQRAAREQWLRQAEVMAGVVAVAGLGGEGSAGRGALARDLFLELHGQGVAYLALRDARLNLVAARSALEGPVPTLEVVPEPGRPSARMVNVSPNAPTLVDVATIIQAPASAGSRRSGGPVRAERKPVGVLQLGLTPEALQSARRLSAVGIWSAPLVATVLSGFLVVVGTRRPRRRLDALVAGVGRRCRGEREGRLDESGDDEISELARALNELVDRLIETENSVRDARWTLEEKVHARTRRLEQAVEQAVEQARCAEEAARAGSLLLAGAAHEFRTPLGGLQDVVERLKQSGLTDEQRHQVERAERIAHQLSRVAREFLEASQSDPAEGVRENDFDLRQEVEDAVELQAVGAASRGVELVVFLDPALPVMVRGDAGKLRHVLSTLLGNVVGNTREGAVVVRVKPLTLDDRKVNLSIEVEASGLEGAAIGTEAMFGAPGGSNARAGGLDEGGERAIAIVKQFVSMMGGQVAWRLLPGGRASFRVELAFARADRPGEPEGLDARLQGGMVVVAGHPEARSHLTANLESWGLEVVSGGSVLEVEDAVEHALDQGTSFLCALVDHPGTLEDNVSLVRSLLVRAPRLHGRILLVSNQDTPSGMAALQAEGIFAVLPRPVRLERLRQTLVRVSNSGDAPSAGAKHPTESRPDTPGRRRGRVLVVEHERANLEATREAIEAIGYGADVAWNGRQAVEAFLRNRYDLVLMACRLPGMDGFEAARAMRRWESVERPGDLVTPIVALTEGSLVQNLGACSRAGITDTLEKPFSRDQLVSMVERWAIGDPVAGDPEEGDLDVALFPTPRVGEGAGVREVAAIGAVEEDEEQPPIRVKALEKIRALQQPGKPDIVATIVNYYLEDAPTMVSAIEQAVAASNPEGVRGMAHRLKSGSANVGAVRLANLCRELEALGRRRETGSMQEVLGRIKEEYSRVESALTVFSSGA